MCCVLHPCLLHFVAFFLPWEPPAADLVDFAEAGLVAATGFAADVGFVADVVAGLVTVLAAGACLGGRGAFIVLETAG